MFHYGHLSTCGGENGVSAVLVPGLPASARSHVVPSAQPSHRQGALPSPHSPTPWPPRQQSLRARWVLPGELFCVNKMTTRLFQKEALTLRPPVVEPPPPLTRPCLQESVSEENEGQADLEKLEGMRLEEKDNQLHLYGVFSPYKAHSYIIISL